MRKQNMNNSIKFKMIEYKIMYRKLKISNSN